MSRSSVTEVGAVVLSGGRSSRYGSDKAAATFHGDTLLSHVVQTVRPLVHDLVVVGPWAPEGIRHSQEPEPHRGPLAGLAHGLRVVRSPVSYVLACDHPLLSPALLGRLPALLGSADAVVPVADGRPQPLVAVYTVDVAGPAEAILARRDGSVRDLLSGITVRWVTPDEWRDDDPDGGSFRDVDVPEDLDRLGE